MKSSAVSAKIHLLRSWKKNSAAFERAGRVLLFLDYDGTLSGIRPRPEQAVLAPSVRRLLDRLKSRRGLRVGIVSGRSLREIRRQVRVPGLVYAGNHGLELEGPGMHFRHARARAFRARLGKIRRELRSSLARHRGVWVEDKGLTLSVHYRAARPAVAASAIEAIRAHLKKELRAKKVKCTAGKKVVEIRPPIRWGKGDILSWIARRWRQKGDLLFYAGDDVTDEDAFRVVRRRGMAVHVGPRPSRSLAPYYLRSPREVHAFLRRLDRLVA